MACAKPSDCAPCSKCPDTPAPVMPRCDVALNDGTFAHATVVVEDGCIIGVTPGVSLLYQPDNNCAGDSGGDGGGDSLPGPPGDAGPAGTITVGTVSSLSPGSPPVVTNVGTANNAILNFGIPAGTPGTPGADPPGGANSTAGALQLVGGRIMSPLPVVWPPVFDVVQGTITGAGVLLTLTKNPANSVVVLDLSVAGLITTFQSQIDAMQAQITALQATVADHESRLVALEPP